MLICLFVVEGFDISGIGLTIVYVVGVSWVVGLFVDDSSLGLIVDVFWLGLIVDVSWLGLFVDVSWLGLFVDVSWLGLFVDVSSLGLSVPKPFDVFWLYLLYYKL